jgi:hypothetical protein
MFQNTIAKTANYGTTIQGRTYTIATIAASAGLEKGLESTISIAMFVMYVWRLACKESTNASKETWRVTARFAESICSHPHLQ